MTNNTLRIRQYDIGELVLRAIKADEGWFWYRAGGCHPVSPLFGVLIEDKEKGPEEAKISFYIQDGDNVFPKIVTAEDFETTLQTTYRQIVASTRNVELWRP